MAVHQALVGALAEPHSTGQHLNAGSSPYPGAWLELPSKPVVALSLLIVFVAALVAESLRLRHFTGRSVGRSAVAVRPPRGGPGLPAGAASHPGDTRRLQPAAQPSRRLVAAAASRKGGAQPPAAEPVPPPTASQHRTGTAAKAVEAAETRRARHLAALDARARLAEGSPRARTSSHARPQLVRGSLADALAQWQHSNAAALVLVLEAANKATVQLTRDILPELAAAVSGLGEGATAGRHLAPRALLICIPAASRDGVFLQELYALGTAPSIAVLGAKAVQVLPRPHACRLSAVDWVREAVSTAAKTGAAHRARHIGRLRGLLLRAAEAGDAAVQGPTVAVQQAESLEERRALITAQNAAFNRALAQDVASEDVDDGQRSGGEEDGGAAPAEDASGRGESWVGRKAAGQALVTSYLSGPEKEARDLQLKVRLCSGREVRGAFPTRVPVAVVFAWVDAACDSADDVPSGYTLVTAFPRHTVVRPPTEADRTSLVAAVQHIEAGERGATLVLHVEAV